MVTNPHYQCCIFNTINLCRPNLNQSLQMHHTKSAQVIALLREVAVSVWRVPPPAPALTVLRSPVWPLVGSWRTGWGWCPTWGTLTWCRAPGLSEPRIDFLFVEFSSWVRGCSDATVLKVVASITTQSDVPKNAVDFLIKVIATQLYRIFTIYIKSAGAWNDSSLVFCWHCVPACIVFCCRLDKETHISCGVLGHAEVERW